MTYPSPFLEHLLAFFLVYIRLEDHTIFLVDLLQLIELLPDVNGESGRNSRTQRGGFAHGRTVYGNTDDVCLGLLIMVSREPIATSHQDSRTCMHKFELLMPPSTASMFSL